MSPYVHSAGRVNAASDTTLRKVLTIHYSYLTQTPLNAIIVVKRSGSITLVLKIRLKVEDWVDRLLLPSPLATLCFRDSLLSMLVDSPSPSNVVYSL